MNTLLYYLRLAARLARELLFDEPARLKASLTALASTLGAFFAPVYPYAAVCTAMVLIDCYTAWALGRRLRRAGHSRSGQLSSRRLGHTVMTLVKIYVALAVAAALQQTLVEGEVWGQFNILRFLATAICFWQLVSILENESSCNGARWAALARRYLADKTRRHTGFDIDDKGDKAPV